MSEQVIMLSLVDFVNLNKITQHYRGIRLDAARYLGVRTNDRLFNRIFSTMTF